MRLTNREKILVLVLLFAVLGYFTFVYIVQPQWVALDEKEIVLDTWEAKQAELDNIEQTMAQLNTQWAALDEEIQTIGVKYFSLVDEQEEIILLFNELLKTPGVKDVSLNFTDPQVLDIEGGIAKLQSVQIAYESEYTALWNLLKAIWKFDNRIMVSGLNMAKGETTLLSGQIALDLHDLSEMTKASENLVVWFNKDTFVKGNPFTPLPGEAFAGTRYLMKSDSLVATQATYTKFVDITGHWAEAAIDNFGRQRFVYGDAENRFFPDAPLTRGELIILLDGLFKWPTPAQPVDLTKFTDYMELGRYESVMAKAIFKGYLSEYIIGYQDGTLRPNNPITYEEFSLVMQKVLEQPDFKWAEEAARLETATGHASAGLTDNKASMTRAEAIYFLNALPN
jgi:hypothetical protein